MGACSSKHDEKSPEAQSQEVKSPAPGAGQQVVVQGLISSVSGDSVEVTQNNGGVATIHLDSSTKVVEYVDAQLVDVVSGSCVTVNFKPGPAQGGAGTAVSVQLNPPASDGKCPQPKTEAAESSGAVRQVIGTVASVAENTINVNATGANGSPSQTDVTVADQTDYTKGAPSDSGAVVQGKCINAWGVKDAGGKLELAGLNLSPADNGGCMQFGVKGH
ncbi:hypothetical protein [[Mycobacterium] zoologicum]|uniref:hypothetical protein n=1 Tax=[Mycobacterium] zoologicum TaxID=2872311 RepID=UPI002CFB7DB6|nr:hypothetical protein [Mycolicibacter sp. MYC101]MEB3065744.1 hypothetical protein [Mycolicibacter sp. MYC101]